MCAKHMYRPSASGFSNARSSASATSRTSTSIESLFSIDSFPPAWKLSGKRREKYLIRIKRSLFRRRKTDFSNKFISNTLILIQHKKFPLQLLASKLRNNKTMERKKSRNSSNIELSQNFIYGLLKHETLTCDVNRQPHQYINRAVYKITMSGSPLCIYININGCLCMFIFM